MASRRIPLSAPSRRVLQIYGDLLRAARADMDLTQSALAERLGVGRHTVMALEKGDPGVSFGIAVEAAAILGIPLLAEDERQLERLASAVASLATLLPERVRRKRQELSDDF